MMQSKPDAGLGALLHPSRSCSKGDDSLPRLPSNLGLKRVPLLLKGVYKGTYTPQKGNKVLLGILVTKKDGEESKVRFH